MTWKIKHLLTLLTYLLTYLVAVVGLIVWNLLQDLIKDTSSVGIFQSRLNMLKTYQYFVSGLVIVKCSCFQILFACRAINWPVNNNSIKIASCRIYISKHSFTFYILSPLKFYRMQFKYKTSEITNHKHSKIYHSQCNLSLCF